MAAALPTDAAAPPGWGPQALAMLRAAQAVAHPGGPTLFDDLVGELAATLGAATVFVAVFADESRTHMRTLAVRLDGRALQNFDYPLAGSPCAQVAGRAYRYVATGVAAEFAPGTIFGAKGMDCYAAFPLTAGTGEPLGLLVAMDRRPLADAALAEALLKIFAGRMAAEIERSRADAALRAAALAVSSARGESVFDELVRFLAAQLNVEVAFIARHEDAVPGTMRMLAMYYDGQVLHDIRYPIAGTPCETVYGREFRVYPSGLGALFPDDPDVGLQGTVSYAGYPLTTRDGRALGNISVASRQPLTQLDRLESLLQIFAVRAAAEIEQQAAREALERSEASYRAIFEATEDAVFVHDWDSGRILDVNPKACELYGYTREELLQVSVADLSSGVHPYTAEQALAHLQRARLGRSQAIEWHRRNKDGSLHWDEVYLKPVHIDGRRRILAFTREITERKQALQALEAREQQYRAIVDGSADALVLWNGALTVVDVNAAFTRLTGFTREDVIGVPFGSRLDADDVMQRHSLIRGALAGHEGRIETRTSRKDGSRFDIELRYLPVRFGGEAYALAIGRDVSERLERERALQRSEARLRATVEAAFDSVIGMDGEGRIVEFNAAAERCFGHRRDDVMGRLLADVILPERHRDAHARGLRHFHASGRGPMIGRLIETSALRADGSEIPVELAISVAAVPEGSIFVGHLRDISERRAADRALRDSEAQYRAIFNASADALVLRDADFRIVDVNETYVTMTGYGRAAVIGQDRVVANPADEHDGIRALHARALAGEPVVLETQLVRRDGGRYELELRGVPIVHRGEPHVLYIGRDITERKRAERALRDSEEQYRAIFNASADGLVLRDADYRAVEVNPAYATMSGYTREEVMAAEHVLTQSDEAVLQRHRAEHRLALAGQELSYETTATRKDGSQMQVEVRGMPVMYRGRQHVLYSARDISARKRTEQALRASEEQYRAIFDASIDAMVLWNSRFERVDVNPAYERIFGWRRDEVIGVGVDGPNPDDAARSRRELVRRALAGEACSAVRETMGRDGRMIPTEVHVIPFTHRGEPHVLVIARDITEQREAEAQRARLERQLRQAQKMEAIGQLTGGIAHDFNNILTSVIGYLVLGQERAESLADATLVRQLGQAHLAAQRARELIAQMLAFARRQRGERRVLALAPLVRQTLQLLRATLPASVAVDSAGLPDGDDAPLVQADPVQLEQLLFNLCINARDAISGPGTIRVRLREVGGGHACASCRAPVGGGRWVELSVADSGCGIAPEVLERMFEPFYSTKEVGRGSGMGLAMVHGIVHDHGGHVDVRTAPGAGTEFRVLLPPADGPAAAAAPRPAGAAAPATQPLPPARVLLVEDEVLVGDFMAELLAGWGLRVQLERDPLRAAAWLDDPGHGIDCLVTDQTMPQMTGLALAQHAHARRPRLPVLLYSGHTAAVDADEARRHGVHAVLAKPVDPPLLRAALLRCLAAPADAAGSVA
ncbi:MAG: PAS domain S-box protein [Rubrivivax sp.]|nr:PAS domain S-box protein [Rubrivivax sp.]